MTKLISSIRNRSRPTWFTALAVAGFLSVAACGVTAPETGEWPRNLQVVFTRPGISPETGEDVHLPERIADMIASARKSVDINIYELSHPVIYQAVVDAQERGIAVRMVGDIDNTHYAGYQALMACGAPMRLGNTSKIMHNKFVIVDDYWLTLGSMNYTDSGALLNNENVLFIQNSNIAAYYKKEMDTMFEKGTFGLDKRAFSGFSDNRFQLDDKTSIEVLFTPYKNAHQDYPSADIRIMSSISNAKHSIYFAMFAFTHPEMAKAMIYMATNRGVQLYGVFDKGWHTASEWSMHQLFVDAGLNVRYDGNENFAPDNPYHGSKVHDKFMVIDAGHAYGQVVTGSFNFSSAAATDGNDENCVIISNEFIANLYAREFEDMYRVGTHPTRGVGGEQAAWHEVVINEINWAGSLTDSGSKNWTDKFVELKNLTGRRINISGWQIVGVTKKNSNDKGYIAFIIPENSWIEAGGHYVVYQSLDSSAFTFSSSAAEFTYLYLHHSDDQNYVDLTLKDTHQNIIDRAGNSLVAPFAGSQSDTLFASMFRTGDDGTQSGSWSTTAAANQYVQDGYTTKTHATPGSD